MIKNLTKHFKSFRKFGLTISAVTQINGYLKVQFLPSRTWGTFVMHFSLFFEHKLKMNEQHTHTINGMPFIHFGVGLKFSILQKSVLHDAVFNKILLKAQLQSVALVVYGVHFGHLSVLCISRYARIQF